MSNYPRTGSESMLLQDRRGRRGHVALATSVPPELKDRLVAHCEHEQLTLKTAIEEALCRYLNSEGF